MRLEMHNFMTCFLAIQLALSETMKSRICSDGEMFIVSELQIQNGLDLNGCIQIDPATMIASSLSLKSCLMTSGVAELCASCYSSTHAAYSVCLTLCLESSVIPTTNGISECSRCMRDFQKAYELTDDEMGTGAVFNTCRVGYADNNGVIQTTGQPLTTTPPPFSMPSTTDADITETRSINYIHSTIFPSVLLLVILS
jgi:hypothetical protein